MQKSLESGEKEVKLVDKIVSGILIALGYISILEGIGLQWIGETVKGAAGWQVAIGGLVVLISGAIWYCAAKSAGKIK
jgi:hypothetical protein